MSALPSCVACLWSVPPIQRVAVLVVGEVYVFAVDWVQLAHLVHSDAQADALMVRCGIPGRLADSYRSRRSVPPRVFRLSARRGNGSAALPPVDCRGLEPRMASGKTRCSIPLSYVSPRGGSRSRTGDFQVMSLARCLCVNPLCEIVGWARDRLLPPRFGDGLSPVRFAVKPIAAPYP